MIFKHYKGDTYQLIGTAIHTTTADSLAICLSEDGEMYAIPLEEFQGTVETSQGIMKRFEAVE